MPRIRTVRGLATVAAALLLAACETSSLLPDDQLVVTNEPAFFELEAVGLDEVSDDVRYFWPVTGLPVSIDVSSQISRGSVLIELRDAGGVVVYSQTAESAVDGNVQGALGVWQIDVGLTDASGSFRFTAQQP